MPYPTADQSLRLRALSAALSEQGIAVLVQGQAGRFELAEGLPPGWPAPNLVGHLPHEGLPAGLAGQFIQARQALDAGAASQTFDFALGEPRHTYQARMRPDGTGILTTIADVTEARERDAAVTALLREVSHRSKNLLAIVQSVAMQTAINSQDTAQFLERFRGRLHALSGTQDLVTESEWRGTYLHSLVAAQLTRVDPSTLAHMRLTGANPLLGPNAALHVGLAIHELAVNAVQHGGLGDGGPGHVWVDARIAAEDGGRADLLIEWQETGLRPPQGSAVARFGTLVLERIVPLSVGGEASFTVTDDAVRYLLRVPPDQFEA